jgi:hypothetical protein
MRIEVSKAVFYGEFKKRISFFTAHHGFVVDSILENSKFMVLSYFEQQR